MIVRLLRKLKKMCLLLQYRKRGIRIQRFVDYENVVFGNYVNIAHHAQISNSEIGLRTSIGRYSKIQFANIGKYCSISWDVTIGALAHPIHAISTNAFPYRKQFGISSLDRKIEHQYVQIGNDVWIGCGSIILPGLSIGDGAVIGAGSVVTHDVGDYEVVAGCPAKHLSWRFPENIICELKKKKWWDYSDEKLKKKLDLFSPEKDLISDESLINQL